MFHIYYPQIIIIYSTTSLLVVMAISFHIIPSFSITLSIFSIFSVLPLSLSQPAVCNGVLVTYRYETGSEISPILYPSDPTHQPYRFISTLFVRNNGPNKLKNWRVFVGFQHNEILVSANGGVLADGTALPANVGNGTILSGSSVTDLNSAIQTAGDVTQMEVRIDLVGTQFGVRAPAVPMPHSISLANDGYSCLNPSTRGNETDICCIPYLNSNQNSTFDQDFSQLQNGDLSIMYDVTSTYESYYWVQVTISNQNPFGRLDNWNLKWDWMEGEFINSMRGAYPKVIDAGDCIFGDQGNFYKNFDFSKVLSCDRTPTIMDLPLSRTNDTNFGLIPFCCRDGTILSPFMDLRRSKSAFQMQVYKMPPNLNSTHLTPPRNWKINSTVGPDYQCGQPIRVIPNHFPDPSGLPSTTSTVASWQVTCNITRLNSKKPKCCVSFSSFFNDSIIPCNTCACGCGNNNASNSNNVCSATEPPLLLPSEALLVPFDNRTRMAKEFASLKSRDVPNPLPCGDNCGVSINWHLLSDFRDGWTSRITLFNWGESDIADWYAAAELDKAMPGFEKVYSIDGKALPNANTTLFLQGLPGKNYLIAERNGSNPRKDPPVPGTQQSVISFTKKQTQGIEVSQGDGFPTKVYFNGEECSLPTMLPSDSYKIDSSSFILIAIFSMLFCL
ncbi:COBRA-like protein 7 [Primulina tabacum]|uniref:COBRA-like protein 7 n=1 Tax=Primulina tabacum TaxID=48773 RepID=UPI003F5977D6